MDPISFVASASVGSIAVGCLVVVATYQVDVMMLVEEYGALLGGQPLLLVGLYALILRNTQTLILVHLNLYIKIHICSLTFSHYSTWANMSFKVQKMPVKLIEGQINTSAFIYFSHNVPLFLLHC